jgi:hypothetical protein
VYTPLCYPFWLSRLEKSDMTVPLKHITLIYTFAWARRAGFVKDILIIITGISKHAFVPKIIGRKS